MRGGANASLVISIVTIDANGNSSLSTALQNVPRADGTRAVSQLTQTGIFTVNANGMGTATIYSTTSSGTKATRTFDLAITQAKVVGPVKIATEVFMMQREPSASAGSGALATVIYKRLPDGGEFTTASLQGTWAKALQGGANVSCSAGIVTFDENGNATHSELVNMPTADAKRVVVPLTGTAVFTVNANGMGTTTTIVTAPDGTTQTYTWDYVITQAEYVGAVKIATEMLAIQREPSTSAGSGALERVIYNSSLDKKVSKNRLAI
jgi:hypothetical protein